MQLRPRGSGASAQFRISLLAHLPLSSKLPLSNLGPEWGENPTLVQDPKIPLESSSALHITNSVNPGQIKTPPIRKSQHFLECLFGDQTDEI